MNHDLTEFAGFSLFLEPDTLEVISGAGIRFTRESRLVSDMQHVLYQPNVLSPDTQLYWTFSLLQAGEAQPAFESTGLTFGLVLLPAMKIGKEYVKTHGHYHSCMPGSSIGYPEVYTHYFGTLYLYLQRRRLNEAAEIDDCALYRMVPGSTIMIPPGYAHILINPSAGPALMGGLYSPDAIHEYGPVREMSGAAYYLIEEAGQEHALLNSNYQSCPPLRWIQDLPGTRFAPPDPSQPLWSSFAGNPQRYTFITDPGMAQGQFSQEDLKR